MANDYCEAMGKIANEVDPGGAERAAASPKLEETKRITSRSQMPTEGEPPIIPTRQIHGVGGTPEEKGKSIMDQILNPIRNKVNDQKLATVAMDDTKQAKITQELNAIKTSTDADSPYAEFMYNMNNGYVREYIRNMDTGEFAQMRDFVRDRFAGTGITGDAARSIENTYKTERLSKIQTKLERATTMEGTTLKQEIDTILSEGLLQRADINKLDFWERIADNDEMLMGMLHDDQIYGIVKKKLGKDPATSEDMEKAQAIFMDTKATKEMLETTIERSEGRQGLEKTTDQAERLLANLDPKDKNIAKNLLDSTGTLTKEEENLEKAVTLIDNDFIPPARQRELMDQITNKRINGETIAKAERESKYAENYNYETLNEKNAVSEYDRIKNDPMGGRDVADVVIRRKVENNLAEVDKIVDEKGSKFWRNTPTKEEQKLIDDITSGKQITPENIETLGKILDKVSATGWEKVRNAIAPIKTLNENDARRIVTSNGLKGYWETTKKWGSILGLFLPMMGYMVASTGLQQIFENTFGYSSIKQNTMSVEELKAAFLKDLNPESRAAMEGILQRFDEAKKVYEFILSIPLYGTYFDWTGGGAGYAIILSFGKDTRLKDIGVALDEKGLIVWDKNDPRGWRAKTEDELRDDYKKDPMNLFKTGDEKWVKKWSDEILGTKKTGIFGPNDEELTTLQAAVLYYRAKGQLTDAETEKLTGMDTTEIKKFVGLEGKGTKDKIMEWGDKNLKTTADETTGATTGTQFTDEQKAWLKKAWGLTDEQIKYREDRGDKPVSDGKGGWTFEKGTNTVQGEQAAPMGGGGGIEGTTVTTKSPYIKGLEKTMKEGGKLSQEEEKSVYEANSEEGLNIKHMEELGQTKQEMNQKNFATFRAGIPKYVKEMKGSIRKDDIEELQVINKEATAEALYNTYCTGGK